MTERAKQHTRDMLGPGYADPGKPRSLAPAFVKPKTAHSATGQAPKMPKLNLHRVLPSVVCSATARQSLRTMTRRERRPYTGIYSDRAASSRKQPQNGSQTERIATAHTASSALGTPGYGSTPEPTKSGSVSMRSSMHDIGTGLHSHDSFAWGTDTRLQARQDELLGSNTQYSAVYARVSNVCDMHLRARSQAIRRQADDYRQHINHSIIHPDEPEAMTATKAHLTGTSLFLDNPDTKPLAHIKVKGMRPPSSSQTGRLEQLVFDREHSILRDTLAPAAEVSVPLFSTFLTETGDEDQAAMKKKGEDEISEEGEGKGNKRKGFNLQNLNQEVKQRLQRSASTIKPVVKNVAVINEAIKTWLKGGGRQVRFYNGETILKNNFDAGGKLAKSLQFSKVQHLLEDQKRIIAHPHLDLHLDDNDRPLSKGDFVGYNKEFVDACLPQVRNAQLLRQVVKRCNQVDKNLQTRLKATQDKLSHVHLNVERKLPGSKMLTKQMRAHEEGLAIEIVRALTGVKAIKALQNVRYLIQLGRIRTFRRNRAAKGIQRFVRSVSIVRNMRGSMYWANKRIGQFMANLFRKQRSSQREPSIQIIKMFLKNMQSAAKVFPTIQLFKRRVLRLQRNVCQGPNFTDRITITFSDMIILRVNPIWVKP